VFLLVPAHLGSPTQRAVKRLLSVCLCLSVHKDISGTTRRIFTKFFVHVACVRGSVLLRHVDNKPHRLLAGRGDGSAQRG